MKTSYYPWPNFLAASLCVILIAGCSNASKARRILAVADRDFQAQNYDKAEAEYISVFHLVSLEPVAVRRLGFIYFEEGRLGLAFPYLKKAYEQDKKNPLVQLKLAEIYGKSGKPGGLPLLESVLQSDPGNEHALLLLAQSAPTDQLGGLSQRLETQLRDGGPSPAGCHAALGYIDLRLRKVSEAETEFQKALASDPKLPSAYLGSAIVYQLHKDSKGLRQALKTGAELSPVRSDARLRYAEFELQIGNEEQARQILGDTTRQAPDYIPAWLMLMKMSFEARKYEDCKAAIEKILAEDNSPPNFDATLELGLVALAQNDALKALSAFQRLEEIYGKGPSEAMIKNYLARAHLMNREQSKAMADLNQVLTLTRSEKGGQDSSGGDREYSQAALLLAELDFNDDKPTEAIALLKPLVQKHPENYKAQMLLAEVYLSQHRTDAALEVYQTMMQSFDHNPEIPRRIGRIYEQAGDTANARKAFERSLQLAPDYSATLENITELDILEKHYAQAHERIAEVIKKNPKAAEPLLLEGKVCTAEGRTNEAESAFSKAVELNPELPDGYLDLAQLYLASHQEPQALDRLAPLVAKTNISAMLEVGEIEQSEGKYEQARDTLEKLLAAKPDFGPALNNLAYLYSENLSNIDKALQLAQKARDLYPTSKNTADTLGWILYKKRHYSQALTLIRESADAQPNDPEVQMHLGMAYYMMEEEKPAYLSLRRAVDSAADFPGKDLARRRLEVLEIDPAKATPEVVQKLEELVRQDSQDPVPLSRLASIQEQRGEIQKAAESLQKLVLINPENWSAMMRLARINADHLKELRKAMDLAKAAHALAPNDGGASALLGELIYRTGDYPWSLSLLEQAASQSPDDPSVSYHLALADYAVGRVAAADAAMEKAAQAGPALPNIEQARQFLSLRAAVKDSAQAEASGPLVKQILDKDPNDVPALMVSALISAQHGATNEAGQVWEKVLSIYPLFAPAMRELAIMHSHSLRAEDQNKAYELAEKARASMPDDLQLAKILGVLAYGQNDWSRSLLLLRQSEATNDSVVLYYMGLDYDKLHQRKECTNALQSALALGLADNLAAQAKTILKETK